MAHNFDLIITLTGGLGAALVLGFFTQRLRFSPLVGYLLAGVAVGPFTPGFVAHSGLAEQLAELGIILLMFGVGLHLHVKDLLAVRRIAIPGALIQILVTTGFGVLVTRFAGWTVEAGVVFGLAISVASTVVMLRVLADHHVLHASTGHVAVGWLLVEDIFTVLVLVLLPIWAAPRGEGNFGAVIVSVGIALLKIAGLIAFTLTVGRRAIPMLLGYVAKTRSRELFTLTILVITLGIAAGAAKLFGVSMALGAFLAGMVVGQSEFASRAASEALPMRDAFAVLFFVSVGMLLDPTELVSNAPLTAVTLLVILVGKPIAALLVMLLLRYPLTTAVSVAVALAQIGEFSFILAGLGIELGILPLSARQCLVAASILSITLNPFLFRFATPAAQWWMRRRRKVVVEPLENPHPIEPGHRTIVVGYGPVGRTLARLLRENDLEPFIIELNHETVKQLQQDGIHAIYGDASQREILEQARVREAGSLVFAASGSPDPVIRLAKELNPNLLILARTTYVGEVSSLKKAGAHVVVSAEGEVALAMTERLLRELGATGDQLDRARDRVRAELVDH